MCDNCKGSDVNPSTSSDVNVARRKTMKQLLLGAMAFLPLSLLSKKAEAGWQECRKCYCKAFEGYGDQCKNCGHSFYDHST